MQYILHKGRIECPICHKIFEQDVPPTRIQINPVYQRVRVPVIYIRPSERERFKTNCILIAVVLIILVPVVVIIIVPLIVFLRI